MRNTVRVGFGIAALFAAGTLVVALFGNHQSWFVRAAQANAVRCVTTASCVRINPQARFVKAAPPVLTPSDRCATPGAWATAPGMDELGKIVVMCRDGQRAWLYHMGRLRVGDGGNEQWMACAGPECLNETADLHKLMAL